MLHIDRWSNLNYFILSELKLEKVYFGFFLSFDFRSVVFFACNIGIQAIPFWHSGSFAAMQKNEFLLCVAVLIWYNYKWICNLLFRLWESLFFIFCISLALFEFWSKNELLKHSGDFSSWSSKTKSRRKTQKNSIEKSLHLMCGYFHHCLSSNIP